jgi:hypothetical protein
VRLSWVDMENVQVDRNGERSDSDWVIMLQKDLNDPGSGSL